MKQKLFGEEALEKGYLQAEQLREALAEQERISREEHSERFLGEILVTLGYMTEKQVLDVLNTLHVYRPSQ